MSGRYADIIIDISHEKLDRTFQYRVPEKLQDSLEVGMCVMAPFGNGNVLRKGYCVALGDDCKFDPARTKEIAGIAKKGVGVEDQMIAVAAFLRRHYGGTMIQALKTVLPAKRAVKQLERKKIRRILDREAVISLLGECERKRQTAKARLLRELADQEELPYEWITGRLGVSAATVHSLERAGALLVSSATDYRNPVKFSEAGEKPKELSREQQRIVTEVLQDFDAGRTGTYLIHGITGSGKTEVYMQLIAETIQRGRQAVVLIPEIALTYQTLLRFYRRFGERVSVMNSSLSQGEKYDQCERAKKGEIDVIIGPRSALFVPFPRLGLIVVDEEHESSYKSESTPKYHAREAALEIARLQKASVVLGSATPSLEAYYRAMQGEYRLFRLKERLSGGALAHVSVVDLRAELREGNRSIFSRKLKELLADRLQKGQQSMLFLNRRGYAGFVSCRACGQVMKCPHCDVSLSEHKDGKLLCHYCGYETPKPAHCPKCGSKYIMGFKAGTQQIEEKLKELFPQARTLRMDGDTTKGKDSYERILSAFSNGEADVLIGTQMIVKGHDFPNVTLVGVLAADLSLGANDYRCGERTFQLLTQAVGRAGRGTLPGEAVIQTYQPEHYAVIHAAKQDYEGFYEEEILYRELSGYPPVEHMMAVQIYGKREDAAKQLAEKLSDVVKSIGENSRSDAVSVIGPAPASIGKVNDIFRYVFYVKHGKYERLIYIKDVLEEKLQFLPAREETVQFDFDPMNIL
ncbi:MAG: primosomal protein N' [Candidatus Gastranaerophilales bacterium]|nr:primosomal protein N' [Candidatus Gastranaerophilales bacterium]